MYILNDTHLGVKRTAGTTPASQKALADWQFDQFSALLDRCPGKLLINGDLFDAFSVDNAALLRTFDMLDGWLESDGNEQLVLVAGNHDLSRDSSKTSSFELMAQLLFRAHAEKLTIVQGGGTFVDEHTYVISHVVNQDAFDVELAQASETQAKFVLLHCNYDNRFAQQADHSLNLSEEQAGKLPGFVVLGHEHQHRFALDERVIIVGNQIPTSVADCLGPAYKYVAQLDPATHGVRLEPWLEIDRVFARIDWRDLGKVSPPRQFVRVEGEATAQEAADVVTAIAKFRARSEAFVVSNAVNVQGANVLAGVVESLEKARTYDVVEAILGMLNDEERAIVNRLLGAAG